MGGWGKQKEPWLKTYVLSQNGDSKGTCIMYLSCMIIPWGFALIPPDQGGNLYPRLDTPKHVNPEAGALSLEGPGVAETSLPPKNSPGVIFPAWGMRPPLKGPSPVRVPFNDGLPPGVGGARVRYV